MPSTAKVVGPSGSCANYTSIAAAVNDLPSDSTTQYIYILAGDYAEQVSINRAGATIFRGESDSPLDQSSNKVTITQSGALVSGGGSSEPYSTFYSKSTFYNSKKSKFYNINFVNSYTPQTGYIAIAMDIKAQQVGFYSCGFKSSYGTFLANYGSFYLAGCRIEGSQDFFWGYGAAYVYNSVIVSNTAGYSIAAQYYQSTYGNSQFVFDTCAIVPSSSSIGQSSTYLGRDYTASSRVAYINSFIDGHIKPVGWSIGTTGTNITFIEGNNTGPGASTTSRASKVSILFDTSAFSAANVLGDISWVDTSAIPPFSGFPDRIFPTTSSTTTSATSSATSSSTTGSASSSTTASTTSSAACPTDTLVVKKETTNSCQYTNISAAVSALANDGLEKTILVYPGTYNEQVSITRSGKVNLIGNTTFANDFTQNQVIVEYSYGVSTSANQNELTPTLNSKKSDLAVYNINFHNTFPQTKNYAALAGDFYGSNMAFYGCSFIGFQDTLLLNKGVQVLSNCYIEGSVDFIWGFSTAFMHGCYIASNTAGSSICAMSRASASTAGGYVIDSSLITYTSTYGSTMGQTYLGRPYSNYSRVIYTNSYLDSNINSAGWSVWQTSNPQTNNVLFGEYNNVGPSSSTTNRASFATQLDATAAQAYTLSNWIGDTSWLDMDTYNLAPSYSWTNSSVTTATGTTTSTSAATSTSSTSTSTASSTCGHPSSGTGVPAGAVVVDASNATAGSYSSLTLALAALPSDTTCQTIFMMPGTYVEQAAVNRPGQTRIIGYTTSNPGAGYDGNQVTVSYSRGLSVSPLPTGHSNAETAVIATTSSSISFYNVNFINTANLDGSVSSYVALAGSIYGSHIGFYGCSFIGWQDTLLTGSTAGYQYYESCYIEGAIDFIWGYSAAYFKGCTIAAKRKSSAITAHSRASSSAVGIYVFDQCLVTAPSSYSSAIQSSVYLGRPYSAYARVVYKYSYLDSIVAPAGWKIWSTSDPRTDHITFAEYSNTGPGNWENNAAARQAFQNSTLLTSDTYTLASVMDSTSWIDSTYWNEITVPTAIATSTSTSTATATASATATATKASSTEPGASDYIVSQTAIEGKTVYSSITDAIAAISGISSSTKVTVFIYPGTYNEQLTFNRSGTTVFRGYSANPDDNTKNKVIIQNSYGVDTQADQSNSDSATLYSRAKYIQLYNINLNNVFGTEDDYASLGFAIGNNGYAGFYGCQITGNQDTFDLNSGTSVFAFNTLVEGSIDFIWGAGSAYFLNSTIVPNADGGCMTADKRATNTTVGGMVFDQCTVAATSDVTAGSIYLGRPYNQYARVAWVQSYLDSSIAPAGWSVWSKSNPQTDGVLFGEYHNYGPGASTSSRVSFSEQLSDTDVAQFQLATFFSSQGTSWINFTYVDTTPFVAGVYSSATTTYSTSTSSIAYSTVYTTLPVTVTATVSGSTVTATKLTTAYVTTTDDASTVTVTKTTTDKETAYTTVSQDPVTKYATVKITVGGTSTVSPDAVIVTKATTASVTVGSSTTVTPVPVVVTKYSTESTTVGSSVTVTPAPVIVTKYSTVSTTVGSIVTVTPAPSTVYVYSTITATVDYTSTKAGSTSTVTEVDTVYGTSTSSPAAKTVTVTSTNYATVTKATTAKGKTTTSTVATVTVGGSTKTTTPKATTTYITQYSTVTKTSKVTTTLACVPAAKVKREIPIDRFHIRGLASTSKTTVTSYTTAATAYVTAKPITVTETDIVYATVEKTAKASTVTELDTVTTFAKTSTYIISGGTVTSTATSVSTIDATTTLKAATTTTTSTTTYTSSITGVTTLKASTTTTTAATTVISTISGTTTLKGTTTSTTSTVTATSTISGSTTLKASTTSVTSIVTATTTSTIKVNAPVSTVHATTTVTSKSIVTLPQMTDTITSIKSATTTITSTASAPTVEVDKTVTTTASPTTITAAQSTVTKTTKVKTTSTVYTTTTKYASKATCAA